MSANLTRSMQENLLVMLCFDEKNAAMIRGAVPLEAFESYYQEVAERVYEYIDAYKAAPASHTADLFDDMLEDETSDEAEIFKEILMSLYDNKEYVNKQYTLDRLNEFLRRQQLRIGITEAAAALQSDDEDSLDRAEETLNEHMKKRLDLFEAGVFLSDFNNSLSFLDPDHAGDYMPTGIKELDQYEAGPVRGGLHVFAALQGRGKSHWLVNLGKRALMRPALRVLHISLEMPAHQVMQRYVQTVLGITKRPDKYKLAEFQMHNGQLQDIVIVEGKAQFSLEDPDAREKIQKKLDGWQGRRRKRFSRLLVKHFPSGTLSLQGLKAYLDNLENSINFVPDLLILDYADIMKLGGSIDHRRVALGQMYTDLRGLAGERNMAVATATQLNREAVSRRRADESNLAEDFSKGMTADHVIIYSQTEDEKENGFARLFVSKSRNDKDKFMIAISQNYECCTFVTGSCPTVDQYQQLLEQFSDK